MSTEKQILSDLGFSTHFTDLDNAKYFARLYQDAVRYDMTTGRWYIWAEHFWVIDRDNTVEEYMRASIEHRYRAAANIKDDKLRSATRSWAVKSEGEGRISALRRLLMRQKPIAVSEDAWNHTPDLFAVQNGIIHLRTGELLPGYPEQMINQASPVTYDPKAEAPRFVQFLDEIFEKDSDLIYYIQKAFGYSLTGDVKEQLIFFCHGSGENGKTVLFTVLEKILGSYGLALPAATFLRNTFNTQTNDLAMMENRRFVIASEALSATKMDEQKLKKISGGDTVTARFLNKEFFSFRPSCKLWLFLNHIPMFDDDSHGFWRRVRLVPFQRRFSGKERDDDLDVKLVAEMPGILRWLVDGAQLWYAERLKDTPESILLATSEMRESNNRLVDFTVEWCDENEQSSEKASALYTAYMRWAEMHNLKRNDILSQTMFGRLLTDKYKKIRTNDGLYYQGITLKIEKRI